MTQKRYIPIIDYLKAFAIVLVTTTHFFTYDEKDFLLFIYVIQMGMPLFMFISSYNFAMSATRHGFTSLADLYAPAQMKKHFGAILPAYILMFVFEFLWTTLAGSRYSVGEVLSAFISGGLNGGSHGGYFFCIYWQFLLLRRCSICSCAATQRRHFSPRLSSTWSMNGSSAPSIFRADSIACSSFVICSSPPLAFISICIAVACA